MIIDDIKHINFISKIIIDNNKIICNEKIIEDDIKHKAKNINIIYVEFYVSKCEYNLCDNIEMWETIKNIDEGNMPIYHKNDDFKKFIEFYNEYFNNNIIDIYETKKFTKRNFVFNDEQKCLESVKWENTNYKFDNFNQLFFHVGDNNDMERFGYIYIKSLFYKTNENYVVNKLYDKFDTNFDTIKNTFDYLFNKMKKGVLVGIKSNKLVLFLPFSKSNYMNDFYEELYFDEEDKKILYEYKKTKNPELLKKMEQTVKYYSNKYNIKNISYDRRKWVANDCFFRFEDYEGDKSEALYEDFFVELCKNREIDDCIFFINLRDHPVLNKELKDSYTSIVDRKLDEKYIHSKYCPILSVGCSKENLDLPLVTQDDWIRVSKRIYPDDCKNGYINSSFTIEWKDKINKAQFRGSATGCGIDENTNVRIKASILSKKYPEFLDAGIVFYNRKLKKSLNEPLKIISPKIEKTDFMTLKDKAKFKYILNLDGHVSAYRLGHELSLGSVILIPESKYYLWFSNLLKPYEHYVPVKENLEDLIDKIKWCIDNDNKCFEIANNAKLFYLKYLEKDGIFDYMQNLLKSISLKSLNLKKYDKTIAVITLYKNDIENTRLTQKRYFNYFMNRLLKPICDYEIIIVEQSKDYEFNIGKLKNIGFDYLNKNSKKKFDNYIFCDIDSLPDSNLIEYYFKITDGLNALGTYGTRYDTSIKLPFVGACISCTKSVYEKINGFSNVFWGWGGEDVNLLFRLKSTNTVLYKNKKGSIIDFEEINFKKKSMEEKGKETKTERENLQYEKNYNYKTFNYDGLKTLDYNILYTNYYEDNHHIIVNLKKDESINKYPELYNFNFTLDKEAYKKLKNYIYDIQKIDF